MYHISSGRDWTTIRDLPKCVWCDIAGGVVIVTLVTFAALSSVGQQNNMLYTGLAILAIYACLTSEVSSKDRYRRDEAEKIAVAYRDMYQGPPQWHPWNPSGVESLNGNGIPDSDSERRKDRTFA